MAIYKTAKIKRINIILVVRVDGLVQHVSLIVIFSVYLDSNIRTS